MTAKRIAALKKKAADFNETYARYPLRANRKCFVENGKLKGCLTYPSTYKHRLCGCKVTGNGSLQFPLTVQPCKKHK